MLLPVGSCGTGDNSAGERDRKGDNASTNGGKVCKGSKGGVERI